MGKITGVEIVLMIMGVFAFFNFIVPFLEDIGATQGPLTEVIVLVIILFLLFKEYKT